jgi:hypothetical protein
MSKVKVVAGSYRKNFVSNQVFTLVKGYQVGAKGGYVTVKNEGHFPDVNIQNIKVLVDNMEAIQFVDSNTESKSVVETKIAETDEQAMDRIATRFSILDEMSRACIASDIRAMIVSGPPGVGKSFGVEQQMEKASLFDKIAGKRPRFNIVKGAISGIGLFATLYKYSDAKNVLVFDDCDVWEDPDALNVLKGALDSGKTRRISWNKDSRILREEGIPNTFNFNGSVIFITNLNFNDKRSAKIQAHLDALQSRCHYLDLTINNERDKMLRIKQVHRDSDLFARYEFAEGVADSIFEFMWEHKVNLREISLRMCLKIADLVKVSPTNWKEFAKATCVKQS